MKAVQVELPTTAQKHRVLIEKAALKLAGGEPPRRAFTLFALPGTSEAERANLMAAATARAECLIARDRRRIRIMGIVWCAAGLTPLLFFTITWFRHGTWSLVLLILGVPTLINGIRILGPLADRPPAGR